MTCITAIETLDGNAIIAGDFCGSNGFTRGNVTSPKIFRHSGMLFGYTSSFRFGQIIEHVLDDNTLYPPSDPTKTYEWLVRIFIPKLQEVLKKEDNKGGNAICIVNAQVWEIQSDFSVLRSETGMNAIGSGEYHATAAILASMLLSHKGDLPDNVSEAKKCLETAYSITSTCVPSVSKKFSVIEFK